MAVGAVNWARSVRLVGDLRSVCRVRSSILPHGDRRSSPGLSRKRYSLAVSVMAAAAVAVEGLPTSASGTCKARLHHGAPQGAVLWHHVQRLSAACQI